MLNRFRPRRLVVAATLLFVLPLSALAQENPVQFLDLPTAVTAVRQSGAQVYVLAGSWLKLTRCGQQVCTAPGTPPASKSAADGIPDGAIAAGDGRGITRAWYTRPTGRYQHGVLGDRIEGGGLAVIDQRGQRHDMTLAKSHVFEDLTPRIADLDGDGDNEVVTIRTHIDAGAAIAIYELRDGKLAERAAIAPIGLSHRWLNVAGIDDYTGDGRPDIAIVKTPHIGGRYELWTLRGNALARVAAAQGFSNHAMGSRELAMSGTADVDGDGIADLAVPDARRAALRVLSVAGGRLREITAIGLPARIVTAVGVLAGEPSAVFVAGLEDGRLAILRP